MLSQDTEVQYVRTVFRSYNVLFVHLEYDIIWCDLIRQGSLRMLLNHHKILQPDGTRKDL